MKKLVILMVVCFLSSCGTTESVDKPKQGQIIEKEQLEIQQRNSALESLMKPKEIYNANSARMQQINTDVFGKVDYGCLKSCESKGNDYDFCYKNCSSKY